MSECPISVLSWTLAESLSAVSPSVPLSAPVSFNLFLRMPTFLKSRVFFLVCLFAPRLPNDFKKSYPPKMFCKIYSVSSVLHHTMMDVLICDFLGSLVIKQCPWQWSYNSAPCWLHLYHSLSIMSLYISWLTSTFAFFGTLAIVHADLKGVLHVYACCEAFPHTHR